MTMGDNARSSDQPDGVWRPGRENEPTGLKDRLSKMASGYSRNQKIIAGVTVVAVVAGVFLVSRMTGGTTWAPLYTDLATEDAGAIVAELEEQGIAHELAAGGSTIMVPADSVYDTRLAMSDTALPSAGKVGYGVLDSQGLATSEFGQRVGYQRAMEGELSTTIEALDSVDTAVVHLAIPADQVFAVDETEASASVLVRTRPGQSLSDDQVRAVTNLVASSIEGLTPEAVTVADADGNVLAAPGQEVTGQAGGGTRQKQTAQFESALQSSLDEMLVSVVGVDRSKVSVSADLDFDETNTSRETFEAPAPGPSGKDLVLEESTRTESFTGAGTQAAGVLGPDTPAEATAAGDSDYSLDEADVRFAMNRVVESTNTAPGAIDRLSVAVLLDEDMLSAQQAQDLTVALSAAAGVDTTRGDVLTVTRMPFDQTAADAVDAELKAAEEAEAAAQSREFLQNMMLVAFLTLLLVVAFVSYRLAVRRRNRGQMALEGASQPALPPGSPAMSMVEDAEDGDVLELSSAEDGSQLGDSTDDTTGTDRELVLASVAAEQAADMAEELERMQRDAHLTDLIDNQPDEVASLLRNWLGDRRGASR